MATSQVSVVNMALTKLGQSRVVSIEDNQESARVMRSLWDLDRDGLLALHPWRFAIKRTTLPSLADVPVGSQWSVQFELPEECLRLVQVQEDWLFYHQQTPAFLVEGPAILCNEAAPLFVRYVQRVSNVGLWPPLFCRAMAMQLAADACEKLKQSSTKFDAAMKELDLTIRLAKRANAIEGPPKKTYDGDWLAARND